MTKYIMLFALLIGCGNTSVDGSMSGQVKWVETRSPLIFSNWVEADISTGIMRDGQGSMSSSDYRFYVSDPVDIGMLKEAAKTGELVEITYNVYRFTWVVDNNYVTDVRRLD